MKNNYAGKHVLITGGSSGIGLAAAKLAAQHGANVTILSRRKEVLEQAERDIIGQRSQDTFVKTISADVSNEAEVSQALKDLVAGQGLPDVVINCAGVTHPGEFYLLDSEIFRWNMNINYFGAVYVLKALVPDMMQRRSGMIIFVSSAFGPWYMNRDMKVK